METTIEISWPSRAIGRTQAEVHRLLRDVTDAGGAIGYLSPPGLQEAEVWLDATLDGVRSGDIALATALVDGRMEAMGLWRRRSGAMFAHSADIEKVMVHPAARGKGLGRLIVTSLVERAKASGLETLALGVRGSNHRAIRLYEELGFCEWGRQPNVIEVGQDRYDDVRMFIDLGRAPGVRLRGSGPR